MSNISPEPAPRILKFGTTVGYDLFLCGKETWPPSAYFLYLFAHFCFCPIKYSVKIHLK